MTSLWNVRARKDWSSTASHFLVHSIFILITRQHLLRATVWGICLIAVPGSWKEASKPLEFPKRKESRCYSGWALGPNLSLCNGVTTHGGLVVSFRIGADCAGKTNPMIKRLGFEPHDISPNSGEGKGAEGWINLMANVQLIMHVMKPQ